MRVNAEVKAERKPIKAESWVEAQQRRNEGVERERKATTVKLKWNWEVIAKMNKTRGGPPWHNPAGVVFGIDSPAWEALMAVQFNRMGGGDTAYARTRKYSKIRVTNDVTSSVVTRGEWGKAFRKVES
ncbi:hypothetical protein R3P38DRAFT_2791823 [Favolaschia claudopus]|uniref:Uncharacterized protein n=1 Tax=Favolaschia claudopus TaxID=2862362 RepID=A0AAW0AHE6_9AGAR